MATVLHTTQDQRPSPCSRSLNSGWPCYLLIWQFVGQITVPMLQEDLKLPPLPSLNVAFRTWCQKAARDKDHNTDTQIQENINCCFLSHQSSLSLSTVSVFSKRKHYTLFIFLRLLHRFHFFVFWLLCILNVSFFPCLFR